MSKYKEKEQGLEQEKKIEEAENKPLRVAALKYDQDKNNAPCVVAAGSGYMAQRILQAGIENGITIYHDDSAAALLSKLELGQEIPPELYQIVVNIYMALLEVGHRDR